MDKFALALGVLAGLVQLAGYWFYNRTLDQHKPNAASWFMWAVGGTIELLIFAGLVEHETEEVVSARAKEILPALCAVVVIYIFVRIWRKEKALKLSQSDKFVIGVDSALALFWFFTQNHYISNLLLGLDMIASFWPTLKGTYKDPKGENPLPWMTWTIAYSLLTVVVILQWESAWELIYPGLYAILHGAVWLLSLRKNKITAAV